ncbi:hypothetical protein K7640_03520 [Micromonospora sp. PLK6-60]|uniref:hypothetical protein n=1 Tax=Micromonospora sp. PLK6-60 TaxID=2873383 RepID=UPI001CA6853E|nr:hypothetical protein [Micromonospora sp. PLK6-60]MBY8870910.1 hypothetical protein [Micromonospora sp. PLK6-60]
MDTVGAQLITIDDDEEATAAAAERLLRELRQSDDLASLRRAPRPTAVPVGARSGELLELGTLLATLAAQPEVVAGVLAVVADWQRRRGRGRVEVRIGEHELILDNATADEQRRLTEAFIDRIFPSGP